MVIARSASIHPTAYLSGEVEVGENVTIGPHAILEGTIKIGPDCIIRPGAYLFGNVTLGRGNQVFSGAVLGEKPQHLKYNDEPTGVEIGDFNIFRENVTIHRGTTHSMVTRIGNHNFFMANSHVAHDCTIGNRCILANNALVGGHCSLEDSVFLSGNSSIHQWVRVGRLSLISGNSATSKDVPPFIIQQGLNCISGINVVGLRRAGYKHHEINAIREAFRLLFRAGMVLTSAIDRMERDLGNFEVIQEMVAFLKKASRGINLMRGRMLDEAA